MWQSLQQCDQVFLRIFARVAREIFMVDLKVGHRAARFASTSISTEDLVAQLFVNLGSEPQRWTP